MATVSYNPFATVPIGQTGLAVTRLGLGGASIGGLYREVTDEEGVAVVRHAWDLGIRYFDVAPLYGYGNAERRFGTGLVDRPRDEFVLSTKVGRLAVPHTAIAPDADIDQQLFEGREDAYYQATPPVRMVFDYSYDGIMRSVEESLKRTGLERLDILYIHDPDEHWEAAIGGAYPGPRGPAAPGGGQGHRCRHEPAGDVSHASRERATSTCSSWLGATPSSTSLPSPSCCRCVRSATLPW